MAMIYDIECSLFRQNYLKEGEDGNLGLSMNGRNNELETRLKKNGIKKENSKSCDFIIRDYWGPKTCIKMDDGSEKVLSEPHSDSIFNDLTGKTFKQLLHEGRIISKDYKFCIKCFKTETGEDACECEEPELMDIGTLEDGSVCPKCKVGQLKKIQKAIS